MLKYRVLAIVLLASLLFPACPSGAQIVHEDPERLPVREPYDADRKLAVSLQEMFGSLDRFASHINASDFEASRRDIGLFLASYADFADVYRRSGLNGTDMEAVASTLAFMGGDLNATVASAETYSAGLAQFREYVNGSDTANAAQMAAELQLYYRDASDSAGAISQNSTRILRMLDRTDVDTSGLESGIAGLGRFAAVMEEQNREPSGLSGNARLVLASSSSEVIAGEHILLTAAFRTDGSILYGHLIRFHVDGAPAGSAITDHGGVASLACHVDGSSFRPIIRVRAELDPQGGRQPPASSNVLEIRHRPEPVLLQTQVMPASAVFGDTVSVSGRLTTVYGVPVADQAVTISVAGSPAGAAVTGKDGSFSVPVTIRHDMPAGDCPVLSGYAAVPDCVLMNATSYPAVVVIAPGMSAITLDPAEPAYHGGESASFGGTLTTGDGRPVAGANVTIYAGDVPAGVCVTGADGRYSCVTTIPYNMTPGRHDVYASFDPGEGRALAGSRSGAYAALFEPALPRITASGVPLVIFPGDGLDLAGAVTAADGSPVTGRPVSVHVFGATVTTAVTDAGGCYQVACEAGSSPGIYPVLAAIPGEGLLSGDEQRVGIVLIMPFGRAGVAAIAAALLIAVAIGIGVVRVAGAGRRPLALPAPSVPVNAAQGPENVSAAASIEGELGRIAPAVTGDGDCREAMLSIYRVARLMFRDRDPSLPPSVTHRELYRIVSGRQPSLSASLGTITGLYEHAAFGHVALTRDDIVRSLRSLNEIRGHLYDGGGGER